MQFFLHLQADCNLEKNLMHKIRGHSGKFTSESRSSKKACWVQMQRKLELCLFSLWGQLCPLWKLHSPSLQCLRGGETHKQNKYGRYWNTKAGGGVRKIIEFENCWVIMTDCITPGNRRRDKISYLSSGVGGTGWSSYYQVMASSTGFPSPPNHVYFTLLPFLDSSLFPPFLS